MAANFFNKRFKKKGNHFFELNSLNNSAKGVSRVFFIVTIANIVAVTTFFILALATQNTIFTLILAILFVLFIAFVALTLVFYFKYSFSAYFSNLYNKTRENYAKLANFEKNLGYYEHGMEIKEFGDLNEQVDRINAFIDNAYIMSSNLDYSKLDLEYPNPEDKRLVTEESFIKNHKELILQAELFRNAFVSFVYESENEFEGDEIYKHLYKAITDEFDEIGLLIAKDEKRVGYIAFIPYIDSMSCFKERLEKVVKESVFTEHEAGGAKVAVAKAAAVLYPYSDIKDIIPDLRYAIRQAKEVNVYTPERLNYTNKSVNHTSLNLNNIAKMFESLSKNKNDGDDISKTKNAYQKVLRTLTEHIGFETVGIASYNENKHRFEIDYEKTDADQQPVFANEEYLDEELVNCIDKYADADSSFYFCRRSHLNPEIGAKLDVYAIKSGYFFIVKTEEGIRTVIYYLNREKEKMYLNAYEKESLMVFSAYIAEFSRQMAAESGIHTAERRYRSLMRLTDYNLYAIDRNTYELVELSDGLIDAFGEIKQGELCYQKMYGRDTPCVDCPLRGKSKKSSIVGMKQYVTSMILERKNEDYPTLLMTPINAKGDNSALYNRYDPHLLIHSTYGFVERMDNIFIAKNRGYVLFVNVDNFEQLLEEYGEERLQSRLRFFFRNYRKNHKFGDGEVYAYRDNIFAFVFPEEGRLDILKRSESIYDISQLQFDEKDDKEIPLRCTYIGLEYPQTYNDRIEFMRGFEKYLKENRKMLNQELFILPDTNYVRMASREKFIVSLLDNALQSETISLKYLPEVRGDASKILGAEILMRLTDKYSNTSLSPYEFIPVASKNNRIGKITNYLIKHIGEIYQKYGLTAFKLAGLRYLSLNVDTTYFNDPDFLDNLGSLMERFHLPKGFLRLEFNEEDISNNVDLLKGISGKIRNLDIHLNADNYTGQFISIDKLKELGFTNIKISRSLIKDLEKDPTTISAAKSIIDSINEYGLGYCLVGVESKMQHQMLYEIDPNYMAEGYYFYEPLDLDVLLDKLRVTIL